MGKGVLPSTSTTAMSVGIFAGHARTAPSVGRVQGLESVWGLPSRVVCVVSTTTRLRLLRKLRSAAPHQELNLPGFPVGQDRPRTHLERGPAWFQIQTSRAHDGKAGGTVKNRRSRHVENRPRLRRSGFRSLPVQGVRVGAGIARQGPIFSMQGKQGNRRGRWFTTFSRQSNPQIKQPYRQ